MRAPIRLYVSRSIWIIMVVGGFHTTVDYSRAQHEIFDASVIQKWEAYETFSHGLQGTMRTQRNRNGKTEEINGSFKQNRECALIIEPYNRDPSLMSCTLVNPHYRATITLSKSDPNNATLRKYTPLPEDTEPLSLIDIACYQTSRHFYYSRTKPLRQAILDPTFKVTKVAKEVQNGQELVRVDHNYDYVIHQANRDILVKTHGTLWLDPSQCWCIRRSKIISEAKTRGEKITDTEIEVEHETIDHPSGFPILKSRTDHVKIFIYKNNQKIESSSKTDYALEWNNNVPDSEFTLSAFGLPEPGGAEPVKKPIPMYVWILIAAGVCGALAFAFRYLARRRRASATA